MNLISINLKNISFSNEIEISIQNKLLQVQKVKIDLIKQQVAVLNKSIDQLIFNGDSDINLINVLFFNDSLMLKPTLIML